MASRPIETANREIKKRETKVDRDCHMTTLPTQDCNANPSRRLEHFKNKIRKWRHGPGRAQGLAALQRGLKAQLRSSPVTHHSTPWSKPAKPPSSMIE